MQHKQLFTVKEVAKFLSISVSGVWDKVKNESTFPKPLKLSAKQTRWTDTQLNLHTGEVSRQSNSTLT